MKKLYKYALRDTSGRFVEQNIQTREEAREEKNWYKNIHGTDVKIVQEVYTLQSERVVR